MEDIIHLLPDSVANQIAAGEVVQRPASIIKEMVENSIDADATRIQVLVTDGGKTCVQVIDNGKGMSETDARLSFERHATSKILKAADLYQLHTMGFRGEALASIAAVAQVDLKTRRAEDEVGTFIQIAGSRVERQEPVACPVGSNFAVRNLFFNVPARRKFLKSNQTEFSNIVSDFERIVLVYPNIAFSLHHNGVEVYNLQPASVRQRIIDVFGKKINAELLPAEAETSLIRISGYVGKPESARKKGSHQFFFVNGRYMRHPYFHSAVMHAYDNLIPAGEHVSYFIYFTVNPAAIDVNVHPTKTEIKFDDEQSIWQVLAAVVKESLGKYSDIPAIEFDTVDKPDIPVMGTGPADASVMPRVRPVEYNPFNTTEASRRRTAQDWEKLYDGMQTFRHSGNGKHPGAESLVNNDEAFIVDSLMGRTDTDVLQTPAERMNLWADAHLPQSDIPSQKELFDEVPSLPHFQYKGRFIVSPFSSGLLLVDQHRAHVRILFDTYLHLIAGKKHVSQRLLFPEIVEFSSAEAVVVEQIHDELDALGFDLSNLGGGSYSINGTPTDIEGLDPAKLLHDLVYAAKEQGTDVKDEVERSIALAMAQSAAIVYGQVLSTEETNQLLSQLFQLDTPMRTPDGKIVFSVLDYREIEKKF